MLRLLYYRYKKLGKISTRKGGGLIIRHGRIIRILRYILNNGQLHFDPHQPLAPHKTISYSCRERANSNCVLG